MKVVMLNVILRTRRIWQWLQLMDYILNLKLKSTLVNVLNDTKNKTNPYLQTAVYAVNRKKVVIEKYKLFNVNNK